MNSFPVCTVGGVYFVIKTDLISHCWHSVEDTCLFVIQTDLISHYWHFSVKHLFACETLGIRHLFICHTNWSDQSLLTFSMRHLFVCDENWSDQSLLTSCIRQLFIWDNNWPYQSLLACSIKRLFVWNNSQCSLTVACLTVDPGVTSLHPSLEIDHEIISMIILSLLLIQER